MMYDKQFVLDDEPRVPRAVRYHLGRILRGARAVIVSEVTGTSVKKINGVKLNTKAVPNAMPNDSIDTIAEAVCRIMHAAFIEKNLEADQGEIAALHCRISAKCDAPGRGQPKTPSFDWTYDPEGASSEIDEIGELEKTTLMHLLESEQRSRETDRLHIENMQDRFLTLAEHLGAPIAQVGEILQFAGGLSLQGSQMMVSALEATYSIETQKELENQRTKRSEMMWERVGGWLDIGAKAVFEQLGNFAAKKKSEYDDKKRRARTASGDWRPPQPSAARGDDDEQPEPTDDEQPENEFDDDAQGDDAEQEAAFDEKVRANPVASLCTIFCDSLTGAQSRALADTFTKKELDAFYAIGCTEVDDDAIEAYGELEARISTEKLMRLNALMDDDQREMFGKVHAMIVKLRGDNRS